MACNCKNKDDLIKDLIDAWKNVKWEDGEKQIASARSKICVDCKWNKNNICKQNGLWIPANCRNGSCPIDKWPD